MHRHHAGALADCYCSGSVAGTASGRKTIERTDHGPDAVSSAGHSDFIRETGCSLCSELEQVGEVVYNRFGRPLRAAELEELIIGFDGYIAGVDEISAAVLNAADRLKVISRCGGCRPGRPDRRTSAGSSLPMPRARTVAVAELAIGLMLALARSIPLSSQETKAGGWPRLNGLSLEGKTIGLYGLGSVGKQLARRLSCFDCAILAYDIAPDRVFAAVNGIQLCTQTELLARADFLSLHCPVLPETRDLVNESFLNGMKPGAFLVNTARGELVNGASLLAALLSGRLRGAALDVYDHEPPGADHPLLRLPQVIATPHIGSHTDGATNAMGRMALAECLAVLKGVAPKYRVT